MDDLRSYVTCKHMTRSVRYNDGGRGGEGLISETLHKNLSENFRSVKLQKGDESIKDLGTSLID